MAKQFANQQGETFTTNTQTNPNEHCKFVTTRSDREVGRSIGDNLENQKVVIERQVEKN